MRQEGFHSLMRKNVTELSINRGDLIPAVRRLGLQLVTNQYLRHNALLFAANILAGALAYLLHPFLGRFMSLQDYGQVATFIALSLILSTPTQIVATVAAKYVSTLSTRDDHSGLNDFIRRMTRILLIAGVAATLIFVALSGPLATFFNLNSPLEVMLLSLVFITVFVAPLNQGALQGLQLFGWYSMVTLLAAALRLFFAIAFVLLGLGVNGAILGIVAAATLTYLLSFFPLRGILRGPRTPTGSLRALWMYSIFTAVAATGIVVLYSLDTVLARHFLNAADAGLYAALATIGRIVLFVTSSVAVIMFPRVVLLHEKGESHIHVMLQAALGVLGLSLVAEAFFCLAPSLITRLMFGPAFVTISGLLPLYGAAMLLLAVAQVLAMYFLAIGNRIFVIIIFCACVAQIALISWRHAQIVQMVQDVALANAALTLALAIVGVIVYRQSKQSARSAVAK